MTTVEYQIEASADDGRCDGTTWSSTIASIAIGRYSNYYNNAWRWDNVTIPDGATITAAYIIYCYAVIYGSPLANIYFEDAADPDAVASCADFSSRTKTTASVSWSPGSGTDGNWYNSPSIVNIITELLAARSYAAGAAMQCLVVGGGATGNALFARSWDYDDHTYGPKLHIEYTEAAGVNPFYAYAQQ